MFEKTIEEVNAAVRQGRAKELILLGEAIHEKKIAEIAENIRQNERKVVLIAGPSSSGKTTFSRRLCLQLMACGLRPYPISLDDYYRNKSDYPKDENGELDYESLYSLNIELLNEHILRLSRGERVEIPRFDFTTGTSNLHSGVFLQMAEDQVLIFEGIHALNPELTALIPDTMKYGIYIAPMTGMIVNGEAMNPVDNRLLRRTIRDYKYRGTTAADTIHRWESVRKGEKKWIDPFRHLADASLDTSFCYELCAVKRQAIASLQEVDEQSEENKTAQRLLEILQSVEPFTDELEDFVPATSLLKEFLGGCVLD